MSNIRTPTRQQGHLHLPLQRQGQTVRVSPAATSMVVEAHPPHQHAPRETGQTRYHAALRLRAAQLLNARRGGQDMGGAAAPT